VTTLEHPPHCPELAATDVYLFPQLKSALKGQRYCDDPEIKNAPEELKRIPQNGSRNVSNTFTFAGRIVYLHKGTILKEM